MHLVAIAISLIASSPEPAPNVSGASSACQAFVGTKPRPTDFRTLVSKLASLAKGKFETTAEFESRSQRVRSTIPHEVVLLGSGLIRATR